MYNLKRRSGAPFSQSPFPPVRSGQRKRHHGQCQITFRLRTVNIRSCMGPASGAARASLRASASLYNSSATWSALLLQFQPRVPQSLGCDFGDLLGQSADSAMRPSVTAPATLHAMPAPIQVALGCAGCNLTPSSKRSIQIKRALRTVCANTSRTSRSTSNSSGVPSISGNSCARVPDSGATTAPGRPRSGPRSGALQSRALARQSFPAASGMPVQSERPAAVGAGHYSSSGAPAGEHSHTNRLVSEESPYLLQHAHNPVDWYPWGEEAFSRARAEDKPIFLSVGYATCHWCHVMERESFEDEGVAELLNRHFVSIKVDREERPDVDRVYMSYVQAVSGSGGWPMSVWLTPALEPFYGGTYYPPKDFFLSGQLARPGFSTVLRRIAALWGTNREDLKQKAATTLQQLKEALEPEVCPSSLAPAGAAAASQAPPTLTPDLAAAVVEACGQDLARRYDAEYGGFGGAPKFPRPSEINLLLRAQARQMELGDPVAARRLRSMALTSLTAMAAGGMYDHLGGGFHRYSVDELWHVPHFEKMLYDNPQLAATYLTAFQLTGDRQYAQVARGVLDYLLRDMMAPGGGLYSAEDADSLEPGAAAAASRHDGGAASSEPRAGSEAGRAGVGPGTAAGGEGGAAGGGERKEGAFYVWAHAEIQVVLGPELGPFFCMVYGIDEEGNCARSARSDPHGEFEGKNVPYVDVQPEVAAARLGLPYGGDPAEAGRRLAAAREALHAARAARPRPSMDDKIIAAWNGMGLGAFALASRVLASDAQVERIFPSEGRPAAAYLAAALRVAAFVRSHLWQEGAAAVAGAPSKAGAGRLRRSFCRGPSVVAGFADDYACLIAGLLDLYECGGGRQWLEWALELQAVQDELFWDTQSGGYFSTPDPGSPDSDPSIRIRIKDDYDGAEPTASSVSASNLLRLADLVPQRPGAGEQGGTTPLMSYDEAARRTLSAFASRLTQAPLSVPHMCCAAHTLSKRPLRQVIVAGPAGSPDTGALLDAVHAPYCPDKVVLVMDPTDPRDMEFWADRNPAAYGMVTVHFERMRQQQQQQGAAPAPAPATAFICQNFTCLAPTNDPARVRELLGKTQSQSSAVQLQQLDIKM